MAYPRFITCVVNIPIIAVFTKYDQLVTQFWRKDKRPGKSNQEKDDDAERNASDSFARSVKQLQEDWAKLSEENISIPCVKISTTGPNATSQFIHFFNRFILRPVVL